MAERIKKEGTKKTWVDRQDGKDWSVYIDEKEADNGPEKGMRNIENVDAEMLNGLMNRGKKKKK